MGHFFGTPCSSVALSSLTAPPTSNVVENLASIHQSLPGARAVAGLWVVKNLKRLERTETVTFGKTSLNNWTSETYNDISKKQHRQVLPALCIFSENDKSFAKVGCGSSPP